MPMNVVGYEGTGSNAALVSITPIPDPTVQVTGFDILVPAGMNNICYTSAMINSAAATLRAQFRAPSLLAVVPYDMGPIANGLVWPTLWQGQNIWNIPLPLVVAEPLDFLTQNGAAVLQRGFAHFCDGALKPVTGKIYSIRFTATVSTITATWQNGPIVFSSVLPAGNYQVVGGRMWSANGVYFRFVFKGSIWRPGAPMMTAEANQDWGNFRWGAAGIWDVFNNITPPSVDIVGITDTAQSGYMDFIKIS
jgi:hypothetical protein